MGVLATYARDSVASVASASGATDVIDSLAGQLAGDRWAGSVVELAGEECHLDRASDTGGRW